MSQSRIGLQTLILQAGGDELVPQAHGQELEDICKAGQLSVKRLVVDGALHHEILAKPQGRAAVVAFLKKIGEQG